MRQPEAEAMSPRQRIGSAQAHPSQSAEENSPVENHSASSHQAEEDKAEDTGRLARIKWPPLSDKKAWEEMDEDLSKVLELSLKGDIKKKLQAMGRITYSYGNDRFGLVEAKERPPKGKGRREEKINKLKVQIRELKKNWKRTLDPDEKLGLSQLRDDLRSQVAVLSKAERRRKIRQNRRRKRTAFYENPHKFTKKLFEENKSGVLDVPQEELENHLKRTYTDNQMNEELEPIRAVEQPPAPSCQFDIADLRLKEVRDFVKKARSGSAPGPNGIPYKVYKACPKVLRVLWNLLKVA